jgi:hypothetical protein
VPARPARRACQHAAGDCFVGGCKGDMVQMWRVCTVFFPPGNVGSLAHGLKGSEMSDQLLGC